MVHIHNGILLRHKKERLESVLMRWMNLEPIMQSEVSKRKKDKYCIVMTIYMESRKMVLMNLFSGQQWRNRHMGRGEERVRCMERVTWKLTSPYVK